MWRRYLLFISIIIFFILIQTSFATSDLWQNKVNLFIFLLIGCLIFLPLEKCLIWLLISGFLLDLFSHLNFGIITISLFITIFLSHLLIKNYLNYKTWWSISLLMAVSCIIYNILVTIFSYACWKLSFNYFYQPINIIDILYQIVICIFLTIITYCFKKSFKKYLIIYEK